MNGMNPADITCFGIVGICFIFVIVLIGMSYISEQSNIYMHKKDAEKIAEEKEINSLYQAVTDEPLTLFDKESSNELMEDMNWGVGGG